jgi:glycerol-3-phosphate dehydrogenase
VALVNGEIGDFSAYLKSQFFGLTGRWGFSTETAEHLVRCYGRSHMDILALGCMDRKLLDPLGPDCPVIKAEVIYCAEEEMALTLLDFMCRRTDLMHFDSHLGLSVANTVVDLMGRTMDWKRSRRRTEIRKYRQAVQEMIPAMPPISYTPVSDL